MSFRKTLLAATLLSVPMAATANAQSWDPRVTGVYVGAGLGTNYLDDSDSNNGISVSFEWGWAGVLSVGYGFGNGLPRSRGQLSPERRRHHLELGRQHPALDRHGPQLRRDDQRAV